MAVNRVTPGAMSSLIGVSYNYAEEMQLSLNRLSARLVHMAQDVCILLNIINNKVDGALIQLWEHRFSSMSAEQLTIPVL